MPEPPVADARISPSLLPAQEIGVTVADAKSSEDSVIV